MQFLFKADTRAILNNILEEPPNQHLYKSGISLVIVVVWTFVRDFQTCTITSARLDMNDRNFANLAIIFLFYISRVASGFRDQLENVIVDGSMTKSDALKLAKDYLIQAEQELTIERKYLVQSTQNYPQIIGNTIGPEMRISRLGLCFHSILSLGIWASHSVGSHPGDLVCILSPVIFR